MERIALVTGAAGGLGQAVSRKLAAAGWQLVLVSRDAARLHDAYGDNHLQIAADCSSVAGARQVFELVRANGMRASVLAHCIGNIRLGALYCMAEADFMDCLGANLISALHTLAAFVGGLRDAKTAGAAVLVSSAAARIGTPNHEAAAAAKAGLEGLVRGTAATYGSAGIRVNAVALGIMDTPAAAGIIGGASVPPAGHRHTRRVGGPDGLVAVGESRARHGPGLVAGRRVFKHPAAGQVAFDGTHPGNLRPAVLT